MFSDRNYSLASLGLDGQESGDFDNATELCALMMDCDVAAVTILEYESESMYFASVKGTDEQISVKDRVPVENMICRFALADDRVMAIADCRMDPRTQNERMVMSGQITAYAAAPIRDNDGDAIGALCCADDRVREWSDADIDRLRRLARSVEDIIKLRIATKTQKRANEKLRDQARMRASFLSHVVHEIRTPLTSIVGPIFLLEAKELPDDAANLVAISSRSLRRLMTFLDTSLDLARIDEGDFVVTKEPLDIAQLVGEVLENHRPVADMSALELRLRNSLDQAVCRTDRKILERALDRLIANAIKFTGHGHVEVQLRAHRRAGIRIDVVDTGIGIPPERQDVLFDEFEQTGADHARPGGGTGLGMALLKRQLMLLDADIHVSSEPGQGSRFTILLPVDREHAPAD